jgi:hypothetical protein
VGSAIHRRLLKPGVSQRVPSLQSSARDVVSRANLWSVLIFVVFVFATVITLFWIREGLLSKAGRSMDSVLGKTGDNVAKAADGSVATMREAISNDADGDKHT